MSRFSVNSRKFLPLVAAAPIISTAAQNEAKIEQIRPNLIFLLADDLGYGDLSCFNGKKVETPNLDRLAAEGIRFTSFYAGSAVCTPTRVSCLTGRSPLRFNISRHFNDREMYLTTKAVTLPELLKTKGYTSKHIGKWHLGGLNVKHTENRAESIPGPMEHGFDHYLCQYEDPAIRGKVMRQERLYKDGAKHLVEDEKPHPPSNKNWSDYRTEKAMEFIGDMHSKKKPFFLNLWFDLPHAPYEIQPGGHKEKYEKKARGYELRYRTMVSKLDECVGKITEKVKALGIAENTLIVFTSDNGPAYFGSAGALKGRKTDFHEGGIRVPMISWWPGKIKPNQVTDQVAHTNDILPTFCAAAGIEHIDSPIDGKNILPFLTGKQPKFARETLFWQIDFYNSNYQCIQEEKPKPYATEIARKGPWKLLAKDGKALELFNLNEDPMERWNLLQTWPKKAKELESELKAWLAEPRITD